MCAIISCEVIFHNLREVCMLINIHFHNLESCH